ncbi:FAD-dependent oxidoreductase [Anaerohalosphaera lusitana]|uniref:FAD-dependent oxidoreductase n=1 Tax=Anaerohalosphaera lusitana TaxID=1936003 RepID=UPI00197B431F|nr:FAD-dependent oxidoreductase [Anaerohalosphaera lusitana]
MSLVKSVGVVGFVLMAWVGSVAAAGHEVLVEAESFENRGGWVVDQQFVDQMGSPYLLAHGLGEPVDDAVTTVEFPAGGSYKMWVRTKNWAPGAWLPPGRFHVLVNGSQVGAGTTFGMNTGWVWHEGGIVQIKDTSVEIRLRDLTGFDGRCDAIYFSTDTDARPPNDLASQRSWRNRLRGLPLTPPDGGRFDVIVVGGGIAGCGAALAAEERGLDVALVHDRPSLGGNASSEVRVHTLGIHGKGKRILEKIDTEHYPNGSAKAIDDEKKRHDAMKAADGVEMFMPYRAYDVQTEGSRIVSVDAFSVTTGKAVRLHSDVFIDCTGDGWIGYWAGAEYAYGRESRDKYDEGWDKYGHLWSPEEADNRVMGSSLLWYSKEAAGESSFPDVPWAMGVAKDHAAVAGEWYWEYSSDDMHAIDDAEEIRDHILRAIYGSFANAKNKPENANRKLAWVGYILGKRESRRLVGDYVYTMKDATSGKKFDDTVAEEIREIDVHYQRKLTDSPYDFLSRALYRRVSKYYIPFRCLYSKNISNLMMAGRCFSCSHIGLGGPRVMNTCGQMGIATGYAASLCDKYDTNPRGVYSDHIDELKALIAGTAEQVSGD